MSRVENWTGAEFVVVRGKKAHAVRGQRVGPWANAYCGSTIDNSRARPASPDHEVCRSCERSLEAAERDV